MFRMVPDQPSWRSEEFCRRGRKAAVKDVNWLTCDSKHKGEVTYQM